MKTTLFLAITADGLIAKDNDEVTWSEDVWRNYFEYCGNVGYLMVGRKTYELMNGSGEIDKLKLKEFLVISSKSKPNDGRGKWFKSHKDAYSWLSDNGCKHIVVGGGRILANTLLKENLIDEIQLDIEPKLYGSGIQLFGKTDKEYDLELLETRKSGINTVRVLYRVKR